jgi:hypothetical protein
VIKAIETQYKGYRFRSRLEARWAVWLDEIGWAWEFEPEGFELADGERYLPDFLLRAAAGGDIPQGRPLCWLEIKPQPPTHGERRKAEMLAVQSKIPVLFGVGLPCPATISLGLDGYAEDGTFFQAAGALDAYCFRKWGRPGWLMFGSPTTADHLACAAARGARFEFGESGACKQ